MILYIISYLFLKNTHTAVAINQSMRILLCSYYCACSHVCVCGISYLGILFIVGQKPYELMFLLMYIQLNIKFILSILYPMLNTIIVQILV